MSGPEQAKDPVPVPAPVGGVPEGTSYMVWLHAAKLADTTVRGLLEDTLQVQAVAYGRAMADLACRPETRDHPEVAAWMRERAAERAPHRPVPPRPAPPQCRPPSAAEQLLGAERVATAALVALQGGEPERALHLLVAAAHQVVCAIKDFQDKQETKQTKQTARDEGLL